MFFSTFFCVCVLSASSQTAYNILKTHPEVNPDKIGLFGLSLGSIVSIQVAAESTVIKASNRPPISWVYLQYAWILAIR